LNLLLFVLFSLRKPLLKYLENSAIMKEVIIHAGPSAEIIESPVPEPAEGQLRIKVVVSGCNPKDWKVPDCAASYEGTENLAFLEAKKGLNQGDDIAGIVDKVGPGITEFKVRNTPVWCSHFY
jgi:NADPH:quinone reductase-like Zn-dependent oxidoreductase